MTRGYMFHYMHPFASCYKEKIDNHFIHDMIQEKSPQELYAISAGYFSMADERIISFVFIAGQI